MQKFLLTGILANIGNTGFSLFETRVGVDLALRLKKLLLFVNGPKPSHKQGNTEPVYVTTHTDNWE